MGKSKEPSSFEQLCKDGAVKRGDDKEFVFGRIPFAIPALDNLMGGGIPRKRITLFRGQYSSGKSYLASQAVRSVQNAGKEALWVDAELSWDAVWMQKCGVDPTKVYLAQPTTGEDAFGVVKAAMQSGVDLIVLDSLAGLIPADMEDKDFGYNPIAWQARLINTSMTRILPDLRHGSAVIFINQMRSGIGPGVADIMPGGMGQTFFAHYILETRRGQWIEEDGAKVGFEMEIRCRKSKVGGTPQASCMIPFRLEGKLDIMETYIREALEKGLITQKRAWFQYGELPQVTGMANLKKLFVDTPALFVELKTKLGYDAA